VVGTTKRLALFFGSALVVAAAVLGVTARTNSPQFSQQGPKLVGTDAVGNSGQGVSVSLSADGDTALIGGLWDNNQAGAAWVWTRTAGAWSQQGPKLVGSGAVGGLFQVNQGVSVSLSADGNTALVGGDGDNGSGAAWVWTRNAGVWTQQGPKLVGSGGVGQSQRGRSVSLSADGNTALVGGISDNGGAGAVWVWTRSGGAWTQQGPKLVGSGATVGGATQGWSVSLSADGNTALVGGISDNNGAGAVWVWTRSSGVWTQQGNKLVGSGAAGNAQQGWSVSLSADGNTAIVGGLSDNSSGNGQVGAIWVWVRVGGVWTQQGPKLVGSGGVGISCQGASVSLSADGNTAIVGGECDNGFSGAAWVWTRSAGVWSQQGTKLLGGGAVGNAEQGTSIALSGDSTTAIVGGIGDNSSGGLSAGAAWVFTNGPANGSISVVTNLAAATFSITGPNNYSGNGASFTINSAPPGTYTITYNPVNCWATPPPETQTLAAGGTLTFTGGVYNGQATISVSVAPAGATSATFAISPPVTGMPTNGNYPRVQNNVWPQPYTVTFSPVAGFVTPAAQTMTADASCKIGFSGVYTPTVSSGTANLSVSTNIATGAFFQIDKINVGHPLVSLPPTQVPAGTYVIQYLPMAGYYPPTTQTVTLAPGDSVSLQGKYRRLFLVSFTGFDNAPHPSQCFLGLTGSGITYDPSQWQIGAGMTQLLGELNGSIFKAGLSSASLSLARPGVHSSAFTFYSTDAGGEQNGNACAAPSDDLATPFDESRGDHREAWNWLATQNPPLTADDFVAVVGHSYGGHRAKLFVEQLQRAGISTDLLVTVDPIDWGLCNVNDLPLSSFSGACVQYLDPGIVISNSPAKVVISYFQTIGVFLGPVTYPLMGYVVPNAATTKQIFDSHGDIDDDVLVHEGIVDALASLVKGPVVTAAVGTSGVGAAGVGGTPTRTGTTLNYPVIVRVAGSGTATGVVITSATLNGVSASNLAQLPGLGDLAAGQTSGQVNLVFPGTAAAKGATAVLTISGTYSYGQPFTNSARVIVP